MRNTRLFSILGVSLALLFSCDLSDFELDRLTEPSGLDPVLYLPLSSGSYTVEDYVNPFPWTGTTPVTEDPLNFNPIPYPLNGLTFNTSGIDSMIVIVKTVNQTPMKYSYSLSFNGTTIGPGTTLLNEAATDAQGNVTAASRDSLEFKLNNADIRNLATASQVDMTVTLHQPGTAPVVANALRFSQISFKIGFRAPVNLFKLKL